jgi:hypothetical protein
MIPRTSLAGALAALLACATQAHAQSPADAAIPDALRPPPGEQLVLRAHAVGVQIYLCGRGADGNWQWTLKAPDAQLRDRRGMVIIHHYAGPAWKHQDGSVVTGKAVAKVASPDPGSVPWLLLTAVGHEGKGVLDRVSSIQRIHTQGGQPPAAAGCNAAKANAEARSNYAADYWFYAPGG